MYAIKEVNPNDYPKLLERLARMYVDAVAQGAILSQLAGFDFDDAMKYWQDLTEDINTRGRVLLIALDQSSEERELAGTIQLVLDKRSNLSHHAQAVRLIVDSQHRRKGVAKLLKNTLEEVALASGISLITSNTANPIMRDINIKMDYIMYGTIPKYSVKPDGSSTPSYFFYKELE